MSSKPRIIVPDSFYLVTSYGASGQTLFPNDQLKAFFLKELVITLYKFSFQCFGWSIVNDNYHLIIKSSNSSISKFMQRINSVYAKKYNRLHNKNGVVFNKRFSSVVIQKETCLAELIRYVHLNPIRSKVCSTKELDNYKWCGHRAIVKNSPDNILNLKEVLDLFGTADPILKYQEFMGTYEESKTISQIIAVKKGLQNRSDPSYWVIGDETFTQKTLEQDQCGKARILRYIKEGVSLDDMLVKITSCIFFDKEHIHRQGRLNELSTARQMFAIVGHCHFEFKHTDIAKFLKISCSAVSKMISRSGRILGMEILKDQICS